MTYSIIVAVYNRPDELDELLDSLTHQTFTDFEVVIVEDGSTIPCKTVCDRYADRLNLTYHAKPNSGPGTSRNYGCERANGDVFIFLDSDCMVPPTYLAAIEAGRRRDLLEAFGGPDREHDSFSPIQKAISYSMTSILTTGGIRGGKRRVGGAFHPRSFNMGISRAVYEATGGFSTLRFGEDVDFSLRIIESGFRTGLIPEAWVYHKRRTDFKKFFKQVHNSGIARINLSLRHPGSLKLTHFFPASVTAYIVIALGYTLFVRHGWVTLVPLLAYAIAISIDAAIRNRSLWIGGLSVIASFVQLIGYGTGFMRGILWRIILNKPEQHAFEKTFYS
jgi:glycosyltransferase involved in cell wall biosynthesis